MNPQQPAQGNQASSQDNQASSQNNNQGGANNNANDSYKQDQQQAIGQSTATQPGTLGSYETVTKDDGIENPSVEY
ncbi:unnamed protein product [Didymodactylos carnosus]|uniref:Uncharacterized protein n=1 Tax=Didymodactylos carnosus TaxID=1234261 RepID=A0A8S2JUS7_9BILA|nr:unnamed protein product [Didymodactylos carnosus]CAF3823571.1 unnamed protein product [Didymodactylos carnosus]